MPLSLKLIHSVQCRAFAHMTMSIHQLTIVHISAHPTVQCNVEIEYWTIPGTHLLLLLSTYMPALLQPTILPCTPSPHLHINIFFSPLHKLAKTLASAEFLNIWGTLQISTKSPDQHCGACRSVCERREREGEEEVVSACVWGKGRETEREKMVIDFGRRAERGWA